MALPPSHSQAVLPNAHFLALDGIEQDEQGFVIEVRVRQIARCPDCGKRSHSLHSHYQRHLQDLPWQGRTVRLRVRARRFRCRNPACSRKIFVERLPQVAAVYGRQTERLQEIVRCVGFVAGGLPGSRLLARLAIVISDDTVLRFVKLSPVTASPKVSPLVRQTHPDLAGVFRDSYMLEFLELPPSPTEADLHLGLLSKLKEFLIELDRDFCFIGSEFPIQVGGRDFAIDLLFFHRGLNSLVAFELKVGRFGPEYLGKLGFYLEALDRDVRKSHEQASIGVLLCATKDDEVVEYALSRTLSPALVAEYQTKLPDKKLLQAKRHEFYLQNSPHE